jgi:hypothetical protein
MRRTYQKIDLENVDLPGPRQETVMLPKSNTWKYWVGVFVVLGFVSTMVLLNWNAVSQAAFVRTLVGP